MTTQQPDVQQAGVHPVISWAYQVMQSPEQFVVLDTETTDLRGQIVNLAIISGTGKVLFDSLIQPFGDERICEDARRVHGISDEMLLDSPTLAVVWPQVFEILAPMERIVCYNASFDVSRLVHSCKANGIPGVSSSPGDTTLYLLPPWVCLMKKYAEYWNEFNDWFGAPKWQSLSNACFQQGVVHRNWHHALGDCQATLKLLAHLASLYPAPSGDDRPQESEVA